jgi:large subunit ribosomal protein L10
MTREEKSIVIEDLTAQLAGTNIVYVEYFWLNADTTSKLRACYKAGIKLEVIKKYFICEGNGGFLVMIMVSSSVLTGNSAIFISEV